MLEFKKPLLEKLFSLVEYEVPVQSPIFNHRIEDNGKILILSFWDEERRLKVEFLNKTAAIIYCLCDGRKNIADITIEIKKLFPDISDDDNFENTIGLIRKLEAKKILTILKEKHVESRVG